MVEKTLGYIRQQGRSGITRTRSVLNSQTLTNKDNLPYLLVIIFWLVYLIILITAPANPVSKLKYSQSTLYIVRYSVAIQYLIIWLAASYSFLKLFRYSQTISKSKEAKCYYYMAYGVLLLLVSFMASTLISAINSNLRNGGTVIPALTILTNYLYVIPFAAAFGLFWLSSKYLAEKVKGTIPAIKILVFAVAFIIFLYFWLNWIFTNPTRTTSPYGKLLPPTYYLKDSLIVLTIILPAFIGWTISLAAILNLQKYTKYVQGYIYRKAISYLSIGLSCVILGSILVQGLLSLGTYRLISLGLIKLLILIYIFFIIQIIGYTYFALGAKKLANIEKV